MRKTILASLLCGGSLLLPACDRNEDDIRPQGNFQLFVDFWNPDGDQPEIIFDAENTSEAVRIDFDKTFGGQAAGTTFTEVVIDNFRIIDRNNVNYEIDGIRAYEFRNELNGWKEDVEFRMSYERVEDMAVVLVLDRSESLGEDFEKVKTFASDFVTRLYAEKSNLRVGVVDFADEVHHIPLMSSVANVNSYIQGLTQGRFTSLYDAMNQGINMLNEVDAESKALVVFTDGTDNNSNVEYSPAYLEEKLKNEEEKIRISTFAIGLEGKGGVDKAVLQALSLNGGIAAFPGNLVQLEKVFEDFSGGIANVYRLTYTRNRQSIPETEPVSLRFDISIKK
ncbi:MAG: vWA domain-containing protein [Cyclobacteriaceae bacterium]